MGKLVRDRIPDIIRADGGDPLIRVLPRDEYRLALLDKLVEESTEARDAPSGDLLGELADVWEVLAAILADRAWTTDHLRDAADAKRVERGGFQQRLWLEG